MMISDIRIVDLQTYYTFEVARTPLKFGAVVVDAVEFCRVKATVENGRGQVAEGWGGIFLMDFWGWPTTELPHAAKAAAMKELTERYVALLRGHGKAGHPIDIFHDVEDDLRRLNHELCTERGLLPEQPFLGALVCASPVDAALHDAFGNVNGIDSYCGYGPDFMHDLSRYLGPAFAGKYPQDYIRPQYLPKVPIFHLVGGLDKLTRGEIDETDPQDGVPNCLEDWVAHEGMYCLKVKLRGSDLDWDVDRTLAVYEIGKRELARRGQTVMHLTADTNEQCASPEYIIEYLHRLQEAEPDCYDKILYIEQPTERDLTAHRHDMRKLSSMKPVIVDESLTDLESFELAMDLGWSGIALKTCKGHSADMLYCAKAKELGIPYSVQDLTNPSLALIHSVGLGARLYTIMGVEANSRQFFPASTTAAEKRVHGGIFSLVNGEADTSSLRGTGLGYQMERMQE
ncbi:MAG: enolase C-terminal domain-like protein [Armatimonadia bacterium]